LSITGTVLLDFNGHGAIKRWTHEQIWMNSDINDLHNSAKYPIILSMTCLDGFWFGPTLNGPSPASSLGPSLIEEMVRAAGKGAISAFSAGGLGVATGHDTLQGGFYASVFHGGVRRLGPASLAAKLQLFNSGGNYDLLNTFTIIGDPALGLSIWDVTLLPLMRK
jgi:hypothetical protein